MLRQIAIATGALAAVPTALPLIPDNDSWIRIWDFPRIWIAVILLTVLIAGAAVDSCCGGLHKAARARRE